MKKTIALVFLISIPFIVWGKEIDAFWVTSNLRIIWKGITGFYIKAWFCIIATLATGWLMFEAPRIIHKKFCEWKRRKL